MLKKLKIKNFKSHKDTEFEFHPGINVFWGLSQAGKTNIIRALQLLVNNRPLGGKFLTDGLKQGNVVVEGKFYSGETVTVDKLVKVDKKTGEKKLVSTEYRLNNERPFSGVGVQVPDRIVEALNISELNVQEQLSTPFLITESSGQIARVINAITNLSQVDEWVSSLTTKINSVNRDLSKVDNVIESLTKELDVYSDLDEVEDLVKQIEALDFSVNTKETTINEIDTHLERIEECNEDVENLKPLMVVVELIAEAESIQETINRMEEEVERLEEYVEEIDELQQECGDINLLLETEALLIEVEEVSKVISKVEEEAGFLEEVVDKINTYTEDVDKREKQYENSKDELVKLLKKLGRCPLCYGEIDSDCIEKVVSEL